jgi:hypothetical protein
VRLSDLAIVEMSRAASPKPDFSEPLPQSSDREDAASQSASECDERVAEAVWAAWPTAASFLS